MADDNRLVKAEPMTEDRNGLWRVIAANGHIVCVVHTQVLATATADWYEALCKTMIEASTAIVGGKEGNRFNMNPQILALDVAKILAPPPEDKVN